MTKKSTSFMIEPDVIKKIKYLSIDYEKPIGDILEALVKFSESGGYYNDEKFKEQFNALFKLIFTKEVENG